MKKKEEKALRRSFEILTEEIVKTPEHVLNVVLLLKFNISQEIIDSMKYDTKLEIYRRMCELEEKPEAADEELLN